MQITERLQALAGSPTTAVKQVADQLKRDGIKVYDFGVGEPDFGTPENIKDAAVGAMEQNKTKYTTARGIVELREAVAERYNNKYDTSFGPEHVVVSGGAKQSLYNLMMTLVNPGDEVIIPSPYWVSYPALVQLAQGISVFVETKAENNFKVTASEIEAAITPRTKVINLNSPNNPTGAVIEIEELKQITKMAVEKDIALIYDECYECFVFGKEHGNPIQWNQEKVVSVGSASKTYAMTGWRIGWMIGPKEVAAASDRFQGQAASNPNSIAQWAAVEALQGEQDAVDEMHAAYAKRRTLVLDLVNQVDGLTCPVPEGAFYVFPNVSHFFNEELCDSIAIAKYLLEEAHVAVVPGSGFGAEGYVRISYAASEQELTEGLTRMGEALKALK